MKLLVISNIFPPEVRGGAELVCADYVAEFRKLGWDTRVITSRLNGGQLVDEDGVLRQLSFRQPPIYDRDRSWVSQLDKLADYRATYFNGANGRIIEKAVAEFEPDIALVASPYGIGALSVISSLRAAEVPMAALLQDYWLTNISHPDESNSVLKARWLKRGLVGFAGPAAVARSVSRFFAVSAAVKDKHVKAGIPEEAFRVVHYGMPQARIKARPIAAPEEFRLLFAGRLVRAKGLHTLLEALGGVNAGASRRVKLDIVGGQGPDAYMNELIHVAHAAGVDGDINWLGWMTREEVTSLCACYSALVVPSEWPDPLPTVAIEALSNGLPVIAARSGGLPEIVVDGETGLVFDAGNSSALSDCIRYAASLDAASAADWREQALVRARERFCLETNAAKFSALLEELAA